MCAYIHNEEVQLYVFSFNLSARGRDNLRNMSMVKASYSLVITLSNN